MIACNAAESSAVSPKASRESSRYSLSASASRRDSRPGVHADGELALGELCPGHRSARGPLCGSRSTALTDRSGRHQGQRFEGVERRHGADGTPT